MARGRMICKVLSTSQRRAALHQVVPELAEFCQQLYPLLVAHADDFGRLQGDAFTVKHAIDPTSPRGLEAFEHGLGALARVQLIQLYDVDGRRFISIVKFDEYQVGLREIIDAKIEGREVVAPEIEAPPKVVNLMDALRKSLDSISSTKKKSVAAAPPARVEKKRAGARG